MSVLSEKNAVKAAFVAVLGNVLSFTAPDTAANHVFWGVLPEPCTVWPALVVTRTHFAVTEIEAMGQKGNSDDDPNIYTWEYHDQLVAQSQSGLTPAQVVAAVEAKTDTHDAFLDALVTYFQGVTGYYLANSSNVRQCFAAGETITNDSNADGPFELRSGSAVILSRGAFTVKQLPRPPVS